MDALCSYGSSDSEPEEQATIDPLAASNKEVECSSRNFKKDLKSQSAMMALSSAVLQKDKPVPGASIANGEYNNRTQGPSLKRASLHDSDFKIDRNTMCVTNQSTSLSRTPSLSLSNGAKTRPYVSKRLRNNETISNPGSLITKAKSTDETGGGNEEFIGPLPRQSTNIQYCPGELVEAKPMAEPEKCIKNKSPRKSRLKIQAHTSGVNRLDWNPVYTNLLASCSMDNSVRVWDTYLNGICVKSHTFHGGAVKDVKWSPGGMQLLSCGYDKSSRLIDIHTGCQVSLFHQNDYVTCVQYHPIDRNVFLTGGARNGIKSWDVRTGNVITEYHAAFGQVQALAFLPNGQEFFSAAEVIRRNSTDKGIMAWDFISTAILSNQIYQEAFTCTSLKVHPSGCQFIAQSNGNYLAIFSTKRPYKLNKYKRYEGHKVSAYWIGCDFSPDGTLVLSASADGSVYVYNEQSSRLVTSLPGHSGVCMDVSFHPTLPSTVASCGVDGSIIIWT